jgi:hypothetical protein
MTSTLGSALALGTAMGVVTFSGHAMFEAADEKTKADRLAGKEEVKNRFRRPINEVINELGEGRGKSTVIRGMMGDG